MSNVITRFAPSPTGSLHIGGARTAIFNWLLAKNMGGKFVLRIEDTDQIRHVEFATEQILTDLRWLGLDWDDGPYLQSERLWFYDQYIQMLLKRNQAYRRDNAVWFKIPPKDIIIKDAIRKDITFKYCNIPDFVIQKNDGFPTYHFACVVDDYLMGITHIIRGQEHLNSMPAQQMLWTTLFGTDTLPIYAHASVILSNKGGKLSKRDNSEEINVEDFRNSGYSPAAMINFLSLCGWNPGDDREIMSVGELIQAFSIKRLSKSNCLFNRKKLLYFNKKHKKESLCSELRQTTTTT